MNKNYAQENDHMRKMEEEAYLQGNMCFRDWEDGLDDKLQYKMKIAEQKFLKENKNMSVKITKKELKSLMEKLLSERTKRDSEDRTGGRKAGGRRLKPLEEVEELDEAGCGSHGKKEDGGTGSKDCENCKGAGCEHCKKPIEEGEGEGHGDCIHGCQCEPASLEEGEKPDYIDIDKDGDKKESMKKAAADKEKQEESKIQTPEQENTLYESRFSNRNTRLFEKLLKEWTK